VSALYTEDSASTGIVYVLAEDRGSWKIEQRIVTPARSTTDYFGSALALRGDVLIVGALGAAYVFARRDGAWTEVQKLEAPPGLIEAVPREDALGRFAEAVLDGDLALLGAGSCFARRAGALELVQQMMPPPRTPRSRVPALGLRGDTAAIGVPGEDRRGAVHVFVAAPEAGAAGTR
jgi:hypothetical protein